MHLIIYKLNMEEKIRFKIFDTNNQEKCQLEIPSNTRIIDLKKKIIETLNNNIKYIDIELILERPIRKFGKFNLEPGILPKTLDNSKLEGFAFNSEIFSIKIIENNDYVYQEKKFKKKYSKRNSTRTNLHKKKSTNVENNFSFNKNDFPPLSIK